MELSNNQQQQQQQHEVIDLTNDEDDDLNTCAKKRKNVRFSLRYRYSDERDRGSTSTNKLNANEVEIQGSSQPTDDHSDHAEFQLNDGIDTGKGLEEKNDKNETENCHITEAAKSANRNGTESDSSRSEDTDDSESVSFCPSESDKDLDTKPKAKDGLSAYELLRLERIKRNVAKLVSDWIVLFQQEPLRAASIFTFVFTLQLAGVTWVQCHATKFPREETKATSQDP
jgi:hypothetical protein